MLAKNLAIELAPDGIRVNTVALAFVETPPTSGSWTASRPRRCSTPSARSTRSAAAASPADVVEAMLFLAGDGAGWITGTTLPVDGGVLAGRGAGRARGGAAWTVVSCLGRRDLAALPSRGLRRLRAAPRVNETVRVAPPRTTVSEPVARLARRDRVGEVWAEPDRLAVQGGDRVAAEESGLAVGGHLVGGGAEAGGRPGCPL